MVGFCRGRFLCRFCVSLVRRKPDATVRTHRIRDSDEELAGPQPEPEPEEQLFTSRATKRSKAAAEAEAAERARQPEPQYDDEET